MSTPMGTPMTASLNTRMSGRADITGVSGGAVLAAEYDALEQLARDHAHCGLTLLEWMALPTRTMADPDLLVSAPLAPVSFARVGARLGLTLVGPASLSEAAASWAELALGVIAARTVIEEIDRGAVQRLWTDATEMVQLGWPSTHPVDTVTAGLGGALGTFTALLGPDALGAAAWVASGLHGPDGPVLVQPVSVQPVLVQPVPATGGGRHRGPHAGPHAGLDAGPRDVADLTGHLQVVAEHGGTIEVQTLTGPDGRVRHVVYLPGTDDMNPLSHDSQVRDMTENIRLMGGRPTAYGAGILAAMAQAGVRPGEPVLLVGHSQGGMQAVAMAAHGTPYDVTDVVTLGSPTAQIHHYPHGVQVLSLEHVGDAVPELDGAPSSRDPAQVTVRFDDGIEGAIANHSYEHYLAGARSLDASADPTIRASIAGLGGFLAPGQHATSHAFQITRADHRAR